MNTLILTVGLPRSGKSMWAKKQGYPIVNPDSIRLAVHGKPFLKSEEGIVWWVAHQMVEALFLAGHEVVILDATNTTKHRREEWDSEHWDVECICFRAPMETCLRRAEKTGFPAEVIERMNEHMEWPDPAEEVLMAEDYQQGGVT